MKQMYKEMYGKESFQVRLAEIVMESQDDWIIGKINRIMSCHNRKINELRSLFRIGKNKLIAEIITCYKQRILKNIKSSLAHKPRYPKVVETHLLCAINASFKNLIRQFDE
jgi:hypothetical protein